MTTTVILNPMNPMISSRAIHERLLRYWEAKQNSESSSSTQCPLITVSIDVRDGTHTSYEQFALPATA
ncbi:MAG: hypothetical protein SWY16_13355 [Cyanobacteriota bacterium]|nr:hypothetical protein [Cyanobacteriota bacterium]